jgi:hypothetical protein
MTGSPAVHPYNSWRGREREMKRGRESFERKGGEGTSYRVQSIFKEREQQSKM